MKKYLLICSLLILFAGTGCTPAAAADTGAENAPSDAAAGEVLANDNLLLALGMLALEDTQYPLSADQAADLLPLWKAAQSLSTSQTITVEEFQAIFNQIEATLTPEQLAEIESLDLTPEAITELSERYGLTFGPGGGGFDPENLSPEQQATIEALQESGEFPGEGGFPGGGGPPAGGFPEGGPGGGGFPEGGFPGGGPGGGGDLGSLPEAQQTAIAEGAASRSGQGPGGGLPAAFYAAIIEFLEGKIE